MNRIPQNLFLFVLVLLLYCCVSENGEKLALNCNLSDLEIVIVDKIDPTCDTPGSFTLGASGGDGEYSFSIDNIDFSSEVTYSELPPGKYPVSVKDGNDCLATVELILDGEEAITLTVESAGCDTGEGEIVATATGGGGNYQFKLNNSDFSESNIFSDLQFGSYSVTVNDDNGCVTTLSNIQIGVSLENDILPIIENNCALAGCHLDVRSPLYTSNSNIIAAAKRIKARTSAGTMPPTGELPDHEIKLIANWVNCGAEDN